MMRVKMRMNDDVEAEIRAWKNDGFPEGISKTLAKFVYMSLSTPLPDLPDDLDLDEVDSVCPTCHQKLAVAESPIGEE